jgi:hypothetical protein
MTTPRYPIYAGYRFPAEVISHAVWLYFRFPLSLRMVEEMLGARGIIVSHETVRQWARKFSQDFANRIRGCAARQGIRAFVIFAHDIYEEWSAVRHAAVTLASKCTLPTPFA